MPKKSELPVEKRVTAVLALLRKEEPAAQIARRHGISEPTLYRWRDEFVAGGKASLAGQGTDAALTREMAKLQREVESREQVIGELTVANRILKKLSGPSL
jgi:transposase-like protein